uniref:D7-related salivary protein n=1 Tax=Culicoides nubeculosus TaxID=144565 RepID=B9URJ7_CULNU|nr:D7-related salivary protein [Culicoides nubeculosus]
MTSGNICKILVLTVAITIIPNFVECAETSVLRKQCLAKVLPGKTTEDVEWNNVKKEAIENDNREFQCFILCELTNLNILKSDGAVQTNGNPLEPALGDKISECSNLELYQDNCKAAKNAASCLIEATHKLEKYYEVENIFQAEWKKFENSGKLIEWNN